MKGNNNDCNGQVVPHYYIYQIISVLSQVLDQFLWVSLFSRVF